MRKIMREFGVNLVFGLKKIAFKFRNFVRKFGLNFAVKFRNFAKFHALNSLKFSEKKFALKSQNVVD